MSEQQEIDFGEDLILFGQIKKLRKAKAKVSKKMAKKLAKKLKPINDILIDKEKELGEICQHRETKKEYRSVEGGYLNVGYDTTTWRCIYCNKITDSKTVSTGYS